MIIQLKRFQFTQHMKRKLRDLVVFPTDGLDFSRIVTTCDSAVKSEKADNIREEGSGSSKAGSKIDPLNKRGPKSLRLSSEEGVGPEPIYDLFGVVHHQGALSGGHYVASLKSELDGKWRLFNDAQIYEMSSQDVVDPSAYILFYVRRDVKSATLDDFWDTSQREGEGVTEEEVENLMKQRERCVIS